MQSPPRRNPREDVMDESKNPMLPPAVYVNFLRVAQRQSEFFLIFGQVSE